MEPGSLSGGYRKSVRLTLITLFSVALSTFFVDASYGAEEDDDAAIPLTVPKAECGEDDHPETGLQGQVPAPLRAAGFKGFNCNLELIGQSRGDGANWQSAEFKDRMGHTCGYHGTAFTTANRTHLGAPVIDLTHPYDPMPSAYLTTISMLDPWESLKANAGRAILGADNAHNGAGGPEVDFYDLSVDCRFPQLLGSVAVGKADGSTGIPVSVIGHEGSWAPDGLTYYGGKSDTTSLLRSGRCESNGTEVDRGVAYAVWTPNRNWSIGLQRSVTRSIDQR